MPTPLQTIYVIERRSDQERDNLERWVCESETFVKRKRVDEAVSAQVI